MKEFSKQSETEVKIVETVTKETIISLKDLYEKKSQYEREIAEIQAITDGRIDKIRKEHLEDIDNQIKEAEKLDIKLEIAPIAIDNEIIVDKP